MDPSTGTGRDHNCRNSRLISSSSSRHTHQKSTPSHSGCLVPTPTACQYSTTNTADDEHPGSFEDWCSQREQSYPQFQYWTTVLALELSTLIYVRSLREANFSMVSFRLGFYSGFCTIVKSQRTLGMVLGLQSHHITHAEPGQEFIVPNLRCTLPYACVHLVGCYSM